MEFKKCLQCESDFKPHITNLKNGHGKFCSTKCWAKFRHTKSLTTKTCEACGAVFKGKKKRKVCSKKCGTRWMIQSRKKRTVYRSKVIINSLSKEESEIILKLREMPEMVVKIIQILKARTLAFKVYGKYIKEKVKDSFYD